MSYELMPAGYLVSGPQITKYVPDMEEAGIVLDTLLAEWPDYDRDDYTITAVYHLGWRGSDETFPTGRPEYTIANDILAGRQKAR